MKIKSDYILSNMGEDYVVVAVGERTKELCGMISLNHTGAFLWKQLQTECSRQSLEEALIQEYQITEDVAKQAVDRFLEQLSEVDVFEA